MRRMQVYVDKVSHYRRLTSADFSVMHHRLHPAYVSLASGLMIHVLIRLSSSEPIVPQASFVPRPLKNDGAGRAVNGKVN